MIFKRILCGLLAAITAAYGFSCSKNTTYDEPSSEEEISVEYSIPESTETDTAVRITYPMPSDGFPLPETIPEELLQNLEDKCNEPIFVNAMYYCDLETGFTITYNANRYFSSASLYKAPYLYFVFDMIDSGELTLDDIYVYKAARHKFGGTGSVQNMPDGSELTLKEIIEHILIESDNTAAKMLYYMPGGIMSLDTFNTVANKQFKTSFLYKVPGNSCCCNADGVGRIFREIYARSLTSENFAWFVDLMSKANYNQYIARGVPGYGTAKGTEYVVAHKYGMNVMASNDAAIVYYKDRPYLAVILTDYMNVGTNAEFIGEVSEAIFKIHEYISEPSMWE